MAFPIAVSVLVGFRLRFLWAWWVVGCKCDLRIWSLLIHSLLAFCKIHTVFHHMLTVVGKASEPSSVPGMAPGYASWLTINTTAHLRQTWACTAFLQWNNVNDPTTNFLTHGPGCYPLVKSLMWLLVKKKWSCLQGLQRQTQNQNKKDWNRDF